MLQIRFHAQGDLQLTSADIQLDGDLLELALRGLGLRADLFEPLPQPGDVGADAIEIGVLL